MRGGVVGAQLVLVEPLRICIEDFVMNWLDGLCRAVFAMSFKGKTRRKRDASYQNHCRLHLLHHLCET